jgi:D-alanyl-lipoteichoic acid acyltransferase DltB (MBOAT superfamily)
MAMGLAAMFGLRLPINFDSLYKATSIIEFWRRWHMTLSAFLRDYLYIPLGGNRHGPARRYTNIALTMVLGGLWHGAAWTFVFWGALHGALLIVNHLWRVVGVRLPRPVGWVLTFLAVCVGWVFFRAESFDAAWAMVWTMFGGQGFAATGPMAAFGGDSQVIALVIALIWVVAAPNTQQWVAGIHGRSVGLVAEDPPRRYAWAAGRMGAVAVGVLGGAAIIRIFVGGYSEFLYFQF